LKLFIRTNPRGATSARTSDNSSNATVAAARTKSFCGEGIPVRAATGKEPLGVLAIGAVPAVMASRLPFAKRTADALEVSVIVLFGQRLLNFGGFFGVLKKPEQNSKAPDSSALVFLPEARHTTNGSG
jgi:hypothetical protein